MNNVILRPHFLYYMLYRPADIDLTKIKKIVILSFSILSSIFFIIIFLKRRQCVITHNVFFVLRKLSDLPMYFV